MMKKDKKSWWSNLQKVAWPLGEGPKIPLPPTEPEEPYGVRDGAVVMATHEINGLYTSRPTVVGARLERKEAHRPDETIAVLTPAQMPEKAVGVKYSSRDEAVKHIRDGVPPESLKYDMLRSEVDALKTKIESLESGKKGGDVRETSQI